MTAGPYKDIRLELFDARIDDVHVTSSISDSLDSAQVTVEVAVEGEAEGCSVEVTIDTPAEQSDAPPNKTVEVAKGSKTAKVSFDITKPKLWWPLGHGDQSLYTASARLAQKNTPMQQRSTVFGIREVKLIQRPLESAPGETFMFEVNKRPIYICGTNWVPAHNQTPKISETRYLQSIEMARRNNNNMIRIWGGGMVALCIAH